jgi:hypothetical protein
MFHLKPAGLAALKTAKSAVDRLASGTVLSKVPKG